jgi:MoxR-like ATPase
MEAHQLDNLSENELTRFNSYRKPGEHQVYILSQGLKDAIKVAVMLQQPLLITGEPGTGKTALAYKVAAELNRISKGRYRSEPFFFSTKSNSSASDLFYTYDAISHFFDANIARNGEHKAKGVEDYISLQAFGKAIISSLDPGERANIKACNLAELSDKEDTTARNSVVLIDEIDKASRDFPNDILNEIDKYRFSIKEADFARYEKADGTHIFLVMTSNSEKALPEPFLRRCVFYHIEFPDANQLEEILREHAKHFNKPASDELIKWATSHFKTIREKCREKKPATAELINWVRYLAENNFIPAKPDKQIISRSLSTVVKNSDDLKVVEEITKNW